MKKHLLILIIAVSSCGGSNALRQGPKMTDVLSGSIGNEHRKNYRPARVSDESDNLHGYTRTAHNEINHQFPRLPNPDICMYVTPHMGQENTLVPGYTSCFPMFDNNNYALPGEVDVSF